MSDDLPRPMPAPGTPPFSTPPPPPPPSMAPPPGYVGYGGAGDRSRDYQRIGGITKAVVVLQVVSVVVTAIVLVLQASIAADAEDFLDDVISEREFEDRLAAFFGLSLIGGLVAIALLVLLIIWSYRIASNLRKMGREPFVWKPGLTIVVWLLGSCTLNIITFLMLSEHWKASDRDVPAGDPSWKRRPISPLIIVWFVVTLVAQVGTAVASGVQALSGFRGGSTEDVAESLSDRLGIILAAGVLGLVGSVLLIVIVRQLTDRHAAATGER